MINYPTLTDYYRSDTIHIHIYDIITSSKRRGEKDMNQINTKYCCVFAMVTILLGLFNAGCSQLQSKRIDTLEEKMGVLSLSIESKKTKNHVLNELKLEGESLNEEIKQIKDNQIAFKTVQKSQNDASKRLGKELSETRNLLQEIKQNLALVKKDKNKMETQLKRLETLYSKSTEADTSFTKNLLDEAINLYRQEKFEEAILKWEEVPAHDPSKLEAKFNIEIAKDRVREREIIEELKSLLIQRK